MNTLTRRTMTLALAAGLTLGLAACGSEDVTADETTEQPAAQPSPVAEIDTLTGVETAVTLDPAFVEGITGLGLTPGVTGGAEFDSAAGRVSFPITGGNVTYFDPQSGVEPYVQGEISHNQSGLTLTKGDTEVELSDFVVDPADSVLRGKVLVNGKPFPESGQEVPLFFLDGRTLDPLQVNAEAGTAVLEGTTVTLTQEAAEALNMVFETEALTEFFPVGEAKITVKLPS